MTKVRRARAAVTVVFGLSGLVFGSWASRIPAVRDRLDVSDGELGLVLGAMSLGAILAMPVAGLLSARLGSRKTTRGALMLTALVAGVITAAPSLAALVALAFAMGVAYGSTDVAMNAHGVAVEGRYGRPILASFHAAFSAGGLAGGIPSLDQQPIGHVLLEGLVHLLQGSRLLMEPPLFEFVLEADRLRVLPYLDAIAFWEGWLRDRR